VNGARGACDFLTFRSIVREVRHESAPTRSTSSGVKKMALHACPECQKEVSDKAIACPHCGMPQKRAEAAGAASARTLGVGIALALLLLVGGGLAVAFRESDARGPDYARVEQLRAEQDEDGTHDPNVRQRFYRLYKAHPRSAMYIYLWARCVDDAPEQQRLAEEGIRIDPRFSWNYNVLARALARQHHVAEAYDQARKGAALDPGNMQLADKQASLKAILDHKLEGETLPQADGDKTPARYEGLFRAAIKSPDRSDLQAIEATRLAGVKPEDAKGPLSDALFGFVVCANPYSDACARVYVPRDARFKSAWAPSSVPLANVKEHQLMSVAGIAVKNSQGESIVLADSVTVEAAPGEAK
jgi:hypothetical protein